MGNTGCLGIRECGGKWLGPVEVLQAEKERDFEQKKGVFTLTCFHLSNGREHSP
jgi:hypothetical protein